MAVNIDGFTTGLIIISGERFNDTRQEIVKDISSKYGKVCYVNLNKMVNPLKRSMQGQGVDVGKFFFIDAITRSAIADVHDDDRCIYVSSPKDFTRISIAITKVLQSYDPDVIVVDSLSTLVIYEEIAVITQFMHSLINKMNAFGTRLVLLSLKGEKEQLLCNALSQMVDKTISID